MESEQNAKNVALGSSKITAEWATGHNVLPETIMAMLLTVPNFPGQNTAENIEPYSIVGMVQENGTWSYTTFTSEEKEAIGNLFLKESPKVDVYKWRSVILRTCGKQKIIYDCSKWKTHS